MGEAEHTAYRRQVRLTLQNRMQFNKSNIFAKLYIFAKFKAGCCHETLTVQMETTKTAPFENLPRRMRFLWSDTALQLRTS